MPTHAQLYHAKELTMETYIKIEKAPDPDFKRSGLEWTALFKGLKIGDVLKIKYKIKYKEKGVPKLEVTANNGEVFITTPTILSKMLIEHFDFSVVSETKVK